jgi:hypothetical protein
MDGIFKNVKTKAPDILPGALRFNLVASSSSHCTAVRGREAFLIVALVKVAPFLKGWTVS